MILQPWHDIDWFDQAMHAIAGACLVGLSLFVMPWYWGVVLSMTFAAVRERWQHPGQCHAGCRTDLLCWLVGSLSVPLCRHLLEIVV